jgi:hypothetical protein
MPQIQFPNPAGKDAEGKDLPPLEYTGISLGTFGGVETFIVVDEAGRVTAKNKVPAAKTSASATAVDASGSGVTGPQPIH